MAVQINDPHALVKKKDWKDVHSYDKNFDLKKAYALQRWAYNGGAYTNAKNNANIDGKWGAYSQRQADKAGMKISDDRNSFTINATGKTYKWDDNAGDYVEVKNSVPEQKQAARQVSVYHPGQITPKWMSLFGVDVHGLSDEEAAKRGEDWRLSLDNPDQWNEGRYKDMNNFMNSHPGSTEQDYVDYINGLHARNASDVEAGSVMGSATTSLMSLAINSPRSNNAKRATAQRSVSSTKREAGHWVNPGKDVRVRTTQNQTVARGGVEGAIGTRGVAGRTYTPQNTSETYLYRYSPGATRAGQKVGGQWTTESPVIWETQNISAPVGAGSVPVNESAPQEAGYHGPDIEIVAKRQQGGTMQKGSVLQQIKQALQQDPKGTIAKIQQMGQQGQQLMQQIQQAAQQGDPDATEIVQMIQQAVQSAKNGAKLNYVSFLRGKCPEGYEMGYYRVGGVVCAKCAKKAQDGTKIAEDKTDEPAYMTKFRKARKEKCGGTVKKDACGGKAPKECGGGKAALKKCGGKAPKK